MNKISNFFDNKPLWIQGLFLIILFIGGLTILPSLFLGLGMAVYHSADINHLPLYFIQINLLVSQFSGFLLPALCFSYLYQSQKPLNFTMAHHKLLKSDAFYIILISLLLIPIISLLAGLNRLIPFPENLPELKTWAQNMENANMDLIQRLTASSNVLSILLNIGLLAILPAICEEFFFRGALQPYLQKITKNIPLAIGITAFVFSAFHCEFSGFIPRFILGVYLGFLVYYTQSLWSSILAHFIHNTLSILMQYYYMAKDLPINNDEHLTMSNYATGLLCSLLIIVILYLWQKKKALRHT